LVEICQNAEIRLVYLPPYSPDFNPIEEAFAELKAWMRKNYTLAEGFESFKDFIEAGLMSLSDKTGTHFRSCHIHI
jgi:transposase